VAYVLLLYNKSVGAADDWHAHHDAVAIGPGAGPRRVEAARRWRGVVAPLLLLLLLLFALRHLGGARLRRRRMTRVEVVGR
jgi:hypothetical protein